MFQIKTIEQYAFRGFANALESIPLALAENSGLDPIRTLTEIKAKQVADNNTSLGVNCFKPGEYGTYVKSWQAFKTSTNFVSFLECCY